MAGDKVLYVVIEEGIKDLDFPRLISKNLGEESSDQAHYF
jgi:hypothetical protein